MKVLCFKTRKETIIYKSDQRNVNVTNHMSLNGKLKLIKIKIIWVQIYNINN